MKSVPRTEADVPALSSLRKPRSARSGGKKGWSPVLSEENGLARCTYTKKDGFSPHMLVWAKLDGGPWWPARVVSVEEIPEDLKKQGDGRACVKFYGSRNMQTFAWSKNEELLPYDVKAEEFCHQIMPNDLDAAGLKAALNEVQDIFVNEYGNQISKAPSTTLKVQDGEVLSASSNHLEEVVMGYDYVPRDVRKNQLKHTKLKPKGVCSLPVTDRSMSMSKGKGVWKDDDIQEKPVDMKIRRKRYPKKEKADSNADRASSGDLIHMPTKRFGSSLGNSSGLSAREIVKKSRGKRTGVDGVRYYFECIVCDMGGDLLCCDLCPRVYHLDCLKPPLKRTPRGKWICPSCLDSTGAIEAVDGHSEDSKPGFRTRSVREVTTVVRKLRPDSKRGWRLFQRGEPMTQNLDLGKLRKRKRGDEVEHPRKRVSLKLGRAYPSRIKLECGRCGARISSAGNTSGIVFCEVCDGQLNEQILGSSERESPSPTQLIPTRHSKLKPGRCDVCGRAGHLIFCDFCVRGFHKDCLSSPRKRAPRGSWKCSACGSRKKAAEGMDSKGAKGRFISKVVKQARVSNAGVKREMDKKIRSEEEIAETEKIIAKPNSAEVDCILGCRLWATNNAILESIKLSTDEDPGDYYAFGPSNVVLRSEACNYIPDAKSNGGKTIVISLPTCESELHEAGDRVHFVIDEAEGGSAFRAEREVASDTVGCGAVAPVILIGSEISKTNQPSSLMAVDMCSQRLAASDGFQSSGKSSSNKSGTGSPIKQGAQSGISKDLDSSCVDQKRNMVSIWQGACKFAALPKSKSEAEAGLGDSAVDNTAEVLSGKGGAVKVQKVVYLETMKERIESRLVSGFTCVEKGGIGLGLVGQSRGREICNESKGLLLLNRADGGKQDNGSRLMDSSPSQTELQFLVKWSGRAHIHNEWVTEGTLHGIAERKLESFKLKHGSFPKMFLEDQWSIPQRIVAKRCVQNDCDEVFVKWSGLSYEECTWERVDHPVIVRHMELIDAFKCFEEEALRLDTGLLAKDASAVDPVCLRGQQLNDIDPIKVQPSYLKGGSLFPQQMEALNWFRKCWHRHRSVILADEMGLGKTISACSFLASLHYELKVRTPSLVLAPLSTMPNWLAEFALRAASLNVIEYHGCAKARAVIREYEWHADSSNAASKTSSHALKFHVMLTTFEMVNADSHHLQAVPWEVLVADEGHRLKSSSGKLFTLLNTFSFSYRVLLMGTSLQNSFGEMFNLLKFLQPDTFPSLVAFQQKYSSFSTTEQVGELRKLVTPNILCRLKWDAIETISRKVEIIVPVGMSFVQIECYKALLIRNYQVLRNGREQQSLLNVDTQLRKVCNHPYLIAGTEPESGTPKYRQQIRIRASAKLMLLHLMLTKLRAAGHRVVIFSQMTKLLDILQDYLSFEFGQQAFERVDGSAPAGERQAAISRFNQDTSRFVFLVSTHACGLGIYLATADTVIMYDSDFNPQADIQAMNRTHRIGQLSTLLVYRLMVRASVEGCTLQSAQNKLMLDELFSSKTSPQKEIHDIIRCGTEELFQESSGATGDPRLMAGKVDDVEARHKRKLELTEMSQDCHWPVGRCKVVWDDNSVKLLDRSLFSIHDHDLTQGEREGDILGSFKAWDRKEQNVIPVGHYEGGSLGSGHDLDGISETSLAEGKKQWDKLLRSRWTMVQADGEAALERGKQHRRAITFLEPNRPKSTEPGTEDQSSDVEEDAPETAYTSVGRAFEAKLAKRRARQKDRVLQRHSRVGRPIGSEKLAVVTDTFSSEQAGVLNKLNIVQESSESPKVTTTSLLSNRHLVDPSTHAGSNSFVPSDPVHGLVNVSSNVEEDSLCGSAGSPSVACYGKNQSVRTHRTEPQISRHERRKCAHFSGGDDGPETWLKGAASVFGSFSAMSHFLGKPVTLGNKGQEMGVSTISLSTVSQGLESGQSLSQLIPALRQSLGVRVDSSHRELPAELDSERSILIAEKSCNDHFLQQNFGFNRSATPRDSSETKPLFRYGRVNSAALHEKARPSDVALQFCQRTFGGEKTRTTNERHVAGEDSSSPRQEGRNLSGALFGEDSARMTLQEPEHVPRLDASLPNLKQIPGGLNLSLTKGLQFVDSSSAAVAGGSQDKCPCITASVSSPESSNASGKAVHDHVPQQGSTHSIKPRNASHMKDMMAVDASVDEFNTTVITQAFPTLGNLKGAMVGDVEVQEAFGDRCKLEWAEDELDALWAGVRRHGRGNWETMLFDSNLCVLKSRNVAELADRWEVEQVKVFENREQFERRSLSSWTKGKVLTRMKSEPDLGRLQIRGIDHCKHTPRVSATCCSSDNMPVHPDDKFRQPIGEDETEMLSVTSGTEVQRSETWTRSADPLKAAGSYKLSSILKKCGDHGRFDPGEKAPDYHRFVDLQSSRSSPSIPPSVPVTNPPFSTVVSPSNGGSFGYSSHLDTIEKLSDKSLFRTTMAAIDQVAGKVDTGFSAGLGFNTNWRRNEASEHSICHERSLRLTSANVEELEPNLGKTSVSSYEEHHSSKLSTAPSGEGSESVGASALNRLPHEHEDFTSTTEHRKITGLSTKGTTSVTANDSPPSNLPHWLREAVKARSAPMQPPLPPPIAAVVQATNMLYVSSKRLLPPLVHPGYSSITPRNFPQKFRRKWQRQKSNRLPIVLARDEVGRRPSKDASGITKLEGLNQHVKSCIFPFDADVVTLKLHSEQSCRGFSLPESEGSLGFPFLSRPDRPRQQPKSHICTDSAVEIMQARKSVFGLGIMAGLHPSIVSAIDLDELNTQSSSLRGQWLGSGSDSGRKWMSEGLPGNSVSLLSVLPSEQLTSAIKIDKFVTGPSPTHRIREGSFSHPGRPLLPQGLTSGDTLTKACDGGHLQLPEVDGQDNEDSTSSKTLSDPGVRSKRGNDYDRSGEASSEETVSDDGTE